MLPPTMGRVLSAVGAVITVLALLMVWYHVDRPGAAIDDDSTGWQTFTRLRWLVIGGAALTIASAVVAQTRPVLIARTLLGLVVAILIFRRIVSPPDLSAELEPQMGLWVGVVGALLIALGGLVDTGRKVVETYPDFPLWRGPVGELTAGSRDTPARTGAGGDDDPDGPVTIDADYEVLPPSKE
jgi:hypothetical protein